MLTLVMLLPGQRHTSDASPAGTVRAVSPSRLSHGAKLDQNAQLVLISWAFLRSLPHCCPFAFLTRFHVARSTFPFAKGASPTLWLTRKPGIALAYRFRPGASILRNQRNYPDTTALFDHLSVGTAENRMSFAVTADDGKFEWKTRPRQLDQSGKGPVRAAEETLVDLLSLDAAC